MAACSDGGQPPDPLTRDDIPVLVREITRQLRSNNTEVHLPLVPSTSHLCVTAGVSRLDPQEDPSMVDTVMGHHGIITPT